VDRDRHDAKPRACEHHNRCNAAGELGEILGMAGMPETCRVKALFVDRIGHNGGGCWFSSDIDGQDSDRVGLEEGRNARDTKTNI